MGNGNQICVIIDKITSGIIGVELGDQDYFDNILMAPLTQTLIKNTWMYERLACDGTQQYNRTEAYQEYPSVVAILLREIR